MPCAIAFPYDELAGSLAGAAALSEGFGLPIQNHVAMASTVVRATRPYTITDRRRIGPAGDSRTRAGGRGVAGDTSASDEAGATPPSGLFKKSRSAAITTAKFCGRAAASFAVVCITSARISGGTPAFTINASSKG